MAVIDADTHVIETDHTWNHLEPSEQQFRPFVISPRGEGGREYWYIDGKIRGLARQAVTAPDVSALEEKLGRKMAAPQEAREGENVAVRLRHMDQLGVDIQVLWPTLFLERVADRPEAEIAVCRSYNRWLADIWQQAKGRLRWVCVLPLQTPAEALDQLRFAHANGAVAVFMRGIENEHLLHDPCFFPLYEAVSALNMAIGVHAGNANPYVRELLAQRNAPGTFWAYRMSSIGAFHSLLMAGLPDRFPHLRMVFVEIASQWVPWTLKDLARRLPQQRGRTLPENPLKAYRLYVACQSDDDLPYVLTYAGEDNLMMGTDYGHHDHAADLEGLRNLKTAGKGGFLLGTRTEPGQIETTPDVRARELLDIVGRLEAMDSMGVDIQVIYPTLFLAYVTDDAGLEIAVCRSYNQFMAKVWQNGQGRLRWVAVPPLRSIDASIEEINVAKQRGAVGVFFRGIERDRTLDDPYFFPLYQEAARLDMPICVHTGAGCPAFTAIFDVTRSHTFPHTRTLPLMAFRNLVANKVPELFPDLRFGFIEAGASRVPYVLPSLAKGFVR